MLPNPLQNVDTVWIVAYRVSPTLWQHVICTSQEIANIEFEHKLGIYNQVDLLVLDRRT